jgi:hypothetical protein
MKRNRHRLLRKVAAKYRGHDMLKTKNWTHKVIPAVLAGAICVQSSISFGQTGMKSEGPLLTPGRQFYGGDSAISGLIRVHIIGGVVTPGKYFITPQTDLMELVSIAGGVIPQADIENILLRRRDGIPEKKFTLNLRESMDSIEVSPVYFKDNDVLLINSKPQLISPEVMTIVNFTSSILAMTVTLLILNDSLKKRK